MSNEWQCNELRSTYAGHERRLAADRAELARLEYQQSIDEQRARDLESTIRDLEYRLDTARNELAPVRRSLSIARAEIPRVRAEIGDVEADKQRIVGRWRDLGCPGSLDGW